MDILAENTILDLPGPLPGEDYHILIPDATYAASQYGCEGFYYMGRSPRVVLWFKIHDDVGDESLISAIYNVRSISKGGEKIRGRARNPEFVAGWKSRIVRDLATLFPTRYNPRELPTHIPVIPGPVQIEICRVKRDSDRILRTEAFWYSKIHHIVGWAHE